MTPSRKELNEWVRRHQGLGPTVLLAELTATLIALGRSIPLSDRGILAGVARCLNARKRLPSLEERRELLSQQGEGWTWVLVVLAAILALLLAPALILGRP